MAPSGVSQVGPCCARRAVKTTALGGSQIKAEMHDVAVLDDVLRAFEPHLARILGALLAVARDEILIGDGLGADEAFLEIGVDDAGRLRRLAAPRNRPGLRFLRADGEEGHEVEQRIAGANDAGEAGLGEAERGQVFALLGLVAELCYLGLDRRRYD